MAWFTRLINVFRTGALNAEIDEELRSHLEEAAAQGRDAEEARRAFGPLLQTREASRDARIFLPLDSLRGDAIFGMRQLARRKVAAAASVLSLGLAVGSCLAAFRLVDALLLRPLPVKDAYNLYVLRHGVTDEQGHAQTQDDFSYPCFRQLRAALGEQAELMAISDRQRMGFSFGGETVERGYRQYVSASMFRDFGLQPALGRLFDESDDAQPGGASYAVLSYDFWTRRFGQDRNIVGKTLRSGAAYQIIGVAPAGFTGTDTGAYTDVFFPSTANTQAVNKDDWTSVRIWVRPKSGVPAEQVRATLGAALRNYRREQSMRSSFGESKEEVARYVNAPVSLASASAGVSGMQDLYRSPLTILSMLVFLVLLIACANVANLSLAQAEARGREIALRVSLGAGRLRLMQLVLIENVIIALAASLLGALFAWQAAPLIVGMIRTADNPARLALPMDGRTLAFGFGLTLFTTLLFGLAPALRASSVLPAAVLKGGNSRRVKGRLTRSSVAIQVAFCFFVYYCATLFVTTFERMAEQPRGFSTDRLLALETVSKAKAPVERWDAVAEHLRSLPEVESVSLCWWPLMSGNTWQPFIWVQGRRSEEGDTPYFLKVSPGWIETMRIGLLTGRDFAPDDSAPRIAIVNQTFAKRFFAGRDPVGQSFEMMVDQNRRAAVRIVGQVRDARYRDLREPIRPVAYVPFHSIDTAGHSAPWDWASLIIRTKTANPLAMATPLQTEVKKADPQFLVVNVRTQEEIVESHLVRERLLAALALFFVIVAVTLAAIGLFGVLHYGVTRRWREFAIRLAVGAAVRHIVWQVTHEEFWMILSGMAAGVATGVVARRLIESILYRIPETDPMVIAVPLLLTVLVSFAGALPPVVRALRIDPAKILREE